MTTETRPPLAEVFAKYFPDKTPRPQQSQMFAFADKHQKTKHLIVELPTGGGKSNAGMTYGLSFGSKFFVTTPQKMLQKQYIDTISDKLIGTFYGRSNYECVWSTAINELNCKNGHVPATPCLACPYKAARLAALEKRAVILNTALQFNNTYSPEFSERTVLIIDEAHSLERVLCDYDMFSVTKAKCKQLKITFPTIKAGELPQLIRFIKNILMPALTTQRDNFRNAHSIISTIIIAEMDGDETLKLTDDDKRVWGQYTAFVDNINSISMKLAEIDANPTLHVLCVGRDSIDLKHKRAHHNFKKYIDTKFNHVLYMSATFVDLNGFAYNDMGIPRKDFATLQLPPFFENKKGSFSYIPIRRNNARISNAAFGAIVMQVIAIIKSHDDKKGIIHCVNYRQRSDIVAVLESVGNTVFSHESASDKAESLDEFMDHDGQAVFVSPSSTEGLDLPGELCRYVIFTKVPWLSLGDDWVKERMKDDTWYARQALIATVQGSGRGIRHEEDYCHVYYLDDNFDRIIDIMPAWHVDQLMRKKKNDR